MTGVLVPDDRIQAAAPAHLGAGVLGVERGEGEYLLLSTFNI
jgi:hypothetical protein